MCVCCVYRTRASRTGRRRTSSSRRRWRTSLCSRHRSCLGLGVNKP
jgi:hypothetical protein